MLMKPLFFGKSNDMKSWDRSISSMHETFRGQIKYIKNLEVSPTGVPTGLMFQQTSLSEQLISCLSARIIQNYQRPLLLPVPVFPSLNIGLDTAINEAKIAHGAMKTAVVELWWKGWGIQLGRLGKDWKGLDNGNIARLAKGPGINGRTQGTRLRTGMSRMGRSLRLKRLSKKDRGRWTLALPRVSSQWGIMPGGDEACLGLQPCSLHLPIPLRARTMAAVSSGCVCCINLAGWAQNAAWEQTLPPEGEVLMRAVCGNTM